MLDAFAAPAIFACIFVILWQLDRLCSRRKEPLTETASGSNLHETCAVAPGATGITTKAALNRPHRFFCNDEMLVIVDPEFRRFTDAELVNMACSFTVLPRKPEDGEVVLVPVPEFRRFSDAELVNKRLCVGHTCDGMYDRSLNCPACNEARAAMKDDR